MIATGQGKSKSSATVWSCNNISEQYRDSFRNADTPPNTNMESKSDGFQYLF